jgi:hypothetical protein
VTVDAIDRQLSQKESELTQLRSEAGRKDGEIQGI